MHVRAHAASSHGGGEREGKVLIEGGTRDHQDIAAQGNIIHVQLYVSMKVPHY